MALSCSNTTPDTPHKQCEVEPCLRWRERKCYSKMHSMSRPDCIASHLARRNRPALLFVDFLADSSYKQRPDKITLRVGEGSRGKRHRTPDEEIAKCESNCYRPS